MGRGEGALQRTERRILVFAGWVRGRHRPHTLLLRTPREVLSESQSLSLESRCEGHGAQSFPRESSRSSNPRSASLQPAAATMAFVMENHRCFFAPHRVGSDFSKEDHARHQGRTSNRRPPTPPERRHMRTNCPCSCGNVGSCFFCCRLNLSCLDGCNSRGPRTRRR